jgi:hypothetical protein
MFTQQIGDLDKGLFPNAFCKVVPDFPGATRIVYRNA